MSRNLNLNKAKKAKNDEFYTKYKDVENELKYYHKELRNKTLYLNCDNPKYSNFWKYFIDNFHKIELKGLFATYFDEEESIAHCYDGTSIHTKDLEGNGDFRSKESVEILKKSDVVITNPPFSLLKEHLIQPLEHEKGLIILGNINAITYVDVFPYIKDKQLKPGVFFNEGLDFYTDKEEKEVKRVGPIGWFTTFDKSEFRRKIESKEKFNKEEYKTYDNYNAIEVSRIKDIPVDYDGVMGVPVTYLNYHNPNEYKILGSNRGRKQDKNGYYGRSCYINKKETYKRLFIQKI